MKIYKATLKLKGEFKWEYYTKSLPSKKKLIMNAWYHYSDDFEKKDEEFEWWKQRNTDGFDLTDEEFEEFKDHIKYKVKLINVGE